MRPRLGFSPKSPQQDAGMRIEPPPSVAWASGTMPEATAAAAPPDEPPDECSRFHGLRQGLRNRDAVVASRPNSGVLLLPTMMKPAFSFAAISGSVSAEMFSANMREPEELRVPFRLSRSFTRFGTPVNGPFGKSP